MAPSALSIFPSNRPKYGSKPSRSIAHQDTAGSISIDAAFVYGRMDRSGINLHIVILE